MCYFSFLGHFFFAVYGVQVSGGCSIASGVGMFETCESMARLSFVSLAHLAVACSQHELQTAFAACPSFRPCVSRYRKTYNIYFILSIVLRDFSDIDKLNIDNQFNCSSLFHQNFYFSSCLFDISIPISIFRLFSTSWHLSDIHDIASSSFRPFCGQRWVPASRLNAMAYVHGIALSSSGGGGP